LSAAFKNFPDPVAALDEIHPVLRPGAQASILDLRRDAPRAAIDVEIRGMHLSPLSSLFTSWPFRFGLLRAGYTREKLEAVVARSRFGHGEFVEDGVGFELKVVKQRPA
jgi:SAM-dependent methyltransferase